MSDKNYSREKKGELIEKLRSAIDQCLSIIGEDIAEDIKDDKLHNVLKGKKMATEDVSYYLDKLQLLEEDINGVSEESKKRNVVNFAEANAE
jgi:hypothetical protein